MTQATAKPKMKYKSFAYHTHLKHMGGRAGMLRSEGKPEFRVANPPEFKGEAGVWSPEDLFVAAVDTCTMTTFLAFAEHKGLSVQAYRSYAEGLLEMADGGYQFTKIVLRPTIIVDNIEAKEQAREILESAHKKCLIANSIKSQVVVEPNIVASSENGNLNA